MKASVVYGFCGLIMCWPLVSANEFEITGDITRGKIIYDMHCASCHGQTGEGEGVCASRMPVPPRALTDQDYMATLSDQHIFTVIKHGGAAVGRSPVMEAWGDILQTDQAVHDVAAYVRSLAE